jgi:N-acetylmuramoyl-L-alanine amidase
MTWLPVVALVMFVSGLWALVPPRGENVTGLFEANHALPTIVVDAGHGGGDGGAFSNGLREKDLTLDTALRLERHLRAHGFPVVMTRRDDRFLELFERAQIANGIRRALFVSIHFNDSSTGTGEGVETFYAEQKAPFSDDGWSLAGMFGDKRDVGVLDTGEEFARTVQASLVGHLGAIDRGAKPRQLAVVRLTRCPAVLVEGGFLNNINDARKVSREDYRERLAAAIADGVAAYERGRAAQERNRQLVSR